MESAHFKELEGLTSAAIAALSPILGGKPPEVQGMILAWVTAWWLAGHFHPENTAEIRNTLLRLHTQGIRDMIPIAEREILAKVRGKVN